SAAQRLTAEQTTILLLLYLCALASKEMAVTLPVFVFMYEWLYHGRKVPRSAFLWIAVPVTAAYIAYKITGAQAMTANPDYLPHLSARVFLAAWRHYLPDLFYRTIRF